MHAAGYILTGMRRCRRRAHSPMILAHSLTGDFFGLEEIEGWFPDFENFAVWPATARLLRALRNLDSLAGQFSLAHSSHWLQPSGRTIICSRKEAKRARWHNKHKTMLA